MRTSLIESGIAWKLRRQYTPYPSPRLLKLDHSHFLLNQSRRAFVRSYFFFPRFLCSLFFVLILCSLFFVLSPSFFLLSSVLIFLSSVFFLLSSFFLFSLFSFFFTSCPCSVQASAEATRRRLQSGLLIKRKLVAFLRRRATQRQVRRHLCPLDLSLHFDCT
jgi:hypothetical protein